MLNTMKVLAEGTIVLGGFHLGADLRVSLAVEAAMNYILGMNPLETSYASGEGANSITTTFSAVWSYEGIPGIPKGYMPGGPNRYNNPLLYCGAPARCYLDNDSNWTTNENDIGWNAELVLNATLLSQIP